MKIVKEYGFGGETNITIFTDNGYQAVRFLEWAELLGAEKNEWLSTHEYLYILTVTHIRR